MIRIAIDGPGGAGKSTVAKKIAEKLEIIYVDTGALYRTIGLYMLNNGVSPTDANAVIERLEDFSLELKFIDGKQVILLDGVDVGDAIRTPEASMAASAVSAIKEVREYLLNIQRDIAKKNSVIMDGRDIGTVILPNAEVKIFLTASPEARARRRYADYAVKMMMIETWLNDGVYTEEIRDRVLGVINYCTEQLLALHGDAINKSLNESTIAHEEAKKRSKKKDCLLNVPNQFTTEEFAEALEQMGLARNSGKMYLTRLVKGGLVRRIRHGIYEKTMTEEEGES